MMVFINGWGQIMAGNGAYEYVWNLSDNVGACAMSVKLLTSVSVLDYNCPMVIINMIRDKPLTLEYVKGRDLSRSVWLPESAFYAFQRACLDCATYLEDQQQRQEQ